MRYISYISRNYIEKQRRHFTQEGIDNLLPYFGDNSGKGFVHHGIAFSNAIVVCDVCDIIPTNLKVCDDIYAFQYDRINKIFSIWYVGKVHSTEDISIKNLMTLGIFE